MSYELYKPLRNYLRQFPLLESLGVIRAYLQNRQFGQALPEDIQVDRSYHQATHAVQRGVFEWELEILAKELILNAPEAGPRDLRIWHDFSTAVNKLKELEDRTVQRYKSLYSQNILREIARTAHRQFPWQSHPDGRSLNRYFKIFSDEALDLVLTEQIGLSAIQLYRLGLMFTGYYLEKFGLNFPVTVDAAEITKEQLDTFTSRFAIELDPLKEKIRDSQSYNQDYAYTLNPLKIHPLVWVQLRNRRTLIAPVPTYLFRRFTEGVYYELHDAPGFSGAFGNAFQKYVGDVLDASNTLGHYVLLSEQPYHVGKELKDSADWIISDSNGTMFVECKTKKLRYAAKIALTDSAELNDDLEKMAGFIVQVYKTLQDAKNGYYTHWKDNGRPIYPIIVTLEEWYAFGQRIIPAIDEKVKRRLQQLGINTELLENNPYSICAVSDFEMMIQVMALTNIDEVLAKKNEGEYRFWAMRSHLLQSFGDECSKIRQDLFPDEINKICPI